MTLVPTKTMNTTNTRIGSAMQRISLGGLDVGRRRPRDEVIAVGVLPSELARATARELDRVAEAFDAGVVAAVVSLDGNGRHLHGASRAGRGADDEDEEDVSHVRR